MRKYNEQSNICGKLIRKCRLEQDISGEKLAQQLQLAGINMDRTHIYRMENGKVILKDFELLAICKILKMNYSDLEKLISEED